MKTLSNRTEFTETKECYHISSLRKIYVKMNITLVIFRSLLDSYNR